jgi:hypothetical protein
MPRTRCRRDHLDDVDFLARLVGVRAQRPSRVRKQHAPVQRHDGAVNGPLLVRHAVETPVE